MTATTPTSPHDAVKLLAKRILEVGYDDLPERERHVIERVAKRLAVSRDGRTGRFSKPPPQLGQTLWSTSATQAAQKVHSYEQIMASAASGGSGRAQFSQIGRRSSMAADCHAPRQTCKPTFALTGRSACG